MKSRTKKTVIANDSIDAVNFPAEFCLIVFRVSFRKVFAPIAADPGASQKLLRKFQVGWKKFTSLLNFRAVGWIGKCETDEIFYAWFWFKVRGNISPTEFPLSLKARAALNFCGIELRPKGIEFREAINDSPKPISNERSPLKSELRFTPWGLYFNEFVQTYKCIQSWTNVLNICANLYKFVQI